MRTDPDTERNIAYILKRARHHGVPMDEEALRRKVYGPGFCERHAALLLFLAGVALLGLIILINKAQS